MKKYVSLLCVLLVLFVCGCTAKNENAIHTPIETFFAGLNEADYEKYKKSHLPETVDAVGDFNFETKYLEYRKSMQGERVIFEILDSGTLSEKEAKDVKKYYCDELGITYEQLGYVRIRSNLESMKHKGYCVKRDGKWYILSWFTLSED